MIRPKYRSATFRSLVSDADLPTTVARFLALLELFREGVVAFEQASPLGDLYLRWTGDDQTDIDVGAEFDEQFAEDVPEETPAPAEEEKPSE